MTSIFFLVKISIFLRVLLLGAAFFGGKMIGAKILFDRIG